MMYPEPQDVATESQNTPLFVLTYKWQRIFVRIFIFSFFSLFFGFCSIACALTVFELLLFKEIRLHSYKIVKEWKGLGELEIRLADAEYQIGGSKLGSIVQIFDNKKRRFSLTNRLFSYCVLNASLTDVKEFHRVMSKLSGRNIVEFETHTFGKISLVKKETK